MITWVYQNIQSIVAGGEFIIIAVGGFFFVMGGFGGKLNDRRKESDQVADGLIVRLQKTVDQNAIDMGAMNRRIDDQQKEIHLLQGKNQGYLEVLSLRRPDIDDIFKDAPLVHQIIRDTNKQVGEQAKALTDLTKAIETFINNLPPLTATMTK